MKIEQLKKRFTREAMIICAVVALFAALYAGAYYYRSSAEEAAETAQNEQMRVQGQIGSSKTEVGELGKAIARYQNLKEPNLPTLEGYDNTSSRIRAVRPVIEELKNRYKFATLDVTFAGIGPSASLEGEHFQIIESTMEIAFTGPSDELVLAFIHEMLTACPVSWK